MKNCFLLVFFFLLAAPLAVAQQADEVEKVLFTLVNQYRLEHGLDTLASSSLVHAVSLAYAEEMQENAGQRARRTRVLAREDYKQYALEIVPRYLTHAGFSHRIAAIDAQVPYKSAAENLAWGSDAQEIFNSWEESRVHKDNMLESRYNTTGIGVVEDVFGDFWCVQLLVEF